MKRSLKICFAASEAAPLAKSGGLADVAAALPAELQRQGHDVRMFVPLHSAIDLRDLDLRTVEALDDVTVDLGSSRYTFSARVSKLPGTDLDVHLIDCPALYRRASIYTTDPDEAQRFTLFSRAVIECCQRLSFAPDVFHCNDWHTALVPFLLRTVYEWDKAFAESKVLLTIHNLGYQGVFPARTVEDLGLGSWSFLLDQGELNAGRVSFLRTGLIYADAVSTVSPTYAAEIQTDELGMGLQDVLRARGNTVVGILNGVDYDEWSPERDPFIPHPFTIGEMDGKRRNKLHLLETLELAGGEEPPLLGIVSRLAHQKGFDLCFEVLPELLESTDARLVVLGLGERRYEEFFAGLQRAFPGQACFHCGYHNELAHLIEAASDLFLMPSKYEPCGLNQMFSMKYGTIPIVHKTGGLADSVVPVDGSGGDGTGFVFEHFTPDGLRWALGCAVAAYRDPDLWDRLVRTAMLQDFSWKKQVGPYLDLYRNMLDR
jgi:starch synthase